MKTNVETIGIKGKFAFQEIIAARNHAEVSKIFFDYLEEDNNMMNRLIAITDGTKLFHIDPNVLLRRILNIREKLNLNL